MGSIPVSVIFWFALALPLQKCLLRRRDTKKNRDPKIIGERYQIIAGLACSSTRPTREDEILLPFSFLLYILRDPPKGDRRVGVLQ